MGLIILGLILFLVGKIAKIGALETVGKILIIGGLVLWGLGLIGITLPLPF